MFEHLIKTLRFVYVYKTEGLLTVREFSICYMKCGAEKYLLELRYNILIFGTIVYCIKHYDRADGTTQIYKSVGVFLI